MDSSPTRTFRFYITCAILPICFHAAPAQVQEMNHGSIVTSVSIEGDLSQHLIKVTQEELARRGCKDWQLGKYGDADNTIIYALAGERQIDGIPIPNIGETSVESDMYAVISDSGGSGSTNYWIIGHRVRDLYFGLGRLLLMLEEQTEGTSIHLPIHLVAEAKYELRGHQLGYRNTANSWDAWTVDQYDQYIRELTLLGSNAIEDIPFQSVAQSVHMLMPHAEMHSNISAICGKYDLDYWVWTPAGSDLEVDENFQRELKKHTTFYQSVEKLDAVFIPGGDPGDNHPKYVLPFLKAVYGQLQDSHAGAELWVSLQGFEEEAVQYFFDYLQKESPDWLTGVVYGPSSPPIHLERQMLPSKYKHRLYGDITHTVRCQYPTPDWDQAFALTLGREPTNPQPSMYADIFDREMAFTDGFLSYSDGVHDDVNKIIWNIKGWDPAISSVEITMMYTTFFFGNGPAAEIADGILALEKNWQGPLTENGAVEGTLLQWQKLAAENPQLNNNWRWQQLVMRAYYDAFTRRRLLYEQKVEKTAMHILSKIMPADDRIEAASLILGMSDSLGTNDPIRDTIVTYCDRLFSSIGLQTSVDKYQASSPERGCILDFLDHPLNNRWWLQDQFKEIRMLSSEKEKHTRLQQIYKWENPGPHATYDNISRIGQSPHVISRTDDAIDYAWWENGKSRRRLSTQLFQFSPALEYQLNSQKKYHIKIAGYGDALLRANGELVEPTVYDKSLDGFKIFPLPNTLLSQSNGHLKITFDRPNEAHLNWREYSKVSDVWVIEEKN